MQNEYNKQTLEYARYYVENQTTIRKVAEKFNISHSQVHVRFTKLSEELFENEQDKKLVRAVKALLEKNKNERHLRGGEAIRDKYGARRPLLLPNRTVREMRVNACNTSEARKYIKTLYRDKNNLKINYVSPSLHGGYMVGFSYDK